MPHHVLLWHIAMRYCIELTAVYTVYFIIVLLVCVMWVTTTWEECHEELGKCQGIQIPAEWSV